MTCLGRERVFNEGKEEKGTNMYPDELPHELKINRFAGICGDDVNQHRFVRGRAGKRDTKCLFCCVNDVLYTDPECKQEYL